MMLEVLFAQASQGRTFLQMVLCGAALALGVLLSGRLHRLHRGLGMAGDVFCAAGLAAAAGGILLESGEGLRLYGLLGLCIGGALGIAGLSPLLRWMEGLIPRKGERIKPSLPPQKRK